MNHLVAGVMPAWFGLASDSEELWMPIAFTPEQRALHDEHYLTVYGRLKPGMTRERDDAELEAVAARLRREVPRDASTLKYRTEPFAQQFVGDHRARLLVLLAAVVVVLLIACGNVANLLLARGTARAREIAVRTALGAGRARIVRQLLTESVMLALAAAAAGVALAAWSTRALVAWATQGVPRIEQARVDPAALAFAVALGLVSSVLCGLAPTLQLARTDTQTALRDALGASTPAVVRMILESAIRPVAAGAFVGVAAAIGATRALASQLFDVSPTDPLTIAAVVATLFAVALAASVVPARRAATVDPSRALAAE